MVKSISDIVNDVMQQELDYGIDDYTVHNYDLNYYRPIIRYFQDNNTDLYCHEVILKYSCEIAQKHSESVISDYRFQAIKRSIQRIISCAETGKVDFSIKHPKIYQPSEDGMKLYAAIVEYNRCELTLSNNNQAILRNFICFIEQKGIRSTEITDKIILEFISNASNNYKQSNGYIRQSMVLVSDYLKNIGVSLRMNYRELKMKKCRKRMIEPYSTDEVASIIESIDPESNTYYRDKAIFLLAYSTGLRAIDITGLLLTDIDYRNASVSVRQSKTGHLVILPLNITVMNAVADYIMNERPKSNEKHIFLASKAPFNRLKGSRSLGNISRKYCKLAEIEKKPGRDFHSLRRTFASNLSSAEVPLSTISQMLGHESINSDRPYLSYNEKQMLRCALDFSDIPLTHGIYAKEGDAI